MRILKARLHSIALAALTFIAVLLATASPSIAASYTLSFEGTVTQSMAFFDFMGIVPGDPVTGSITYNPFNDIATTSDATADHYNQAAVSFTFHVEHAGGLNFTYSDTGNGSISNGKTVAGIDFTSFGAVSFLDLTLVTDGTPGLTSISALPTTFAAFATLLGGTPTYNAGVFQLAGDWGLVAFETNLATLSVATTPIPAALPLFGSGLIVLGFIGRKRRRAGA